MPTFEIILEQKEPVAAILDKEITDTQLWIIYGLLPSGSYCQWDLAKRWNVDRVISPDFWTHGKLRLSPSRRPRGIKLKFL